MISEHAEKRMNQRGFNRPDVDLLYQFGEVTSAPGGADRITVSGKQIQDLRQILDRIPNGGTLIVSRGKIKTVYKTYRNRKQRRRSGERKQLTWPQ